VDAFQFYKQSGSTQTAHDIAVRDLAPDAILQEDVSYLKSMFADLQPREVQDWQLWGKVGVARILFLSSAD
jgi:nuclear pore complex protein Nup98-Nup96